MFVDKYCHLKINDNLLVLYEDNLNNEVSELINSHL
jgi:hypothetical protein